MTLALQVRSAFGVWQGDTLHPQSAQLALRAQRTSPQTLKSYGEGVRQYLAWCTEHDVDPMVRANLNTWTTSTPIVDTFGAQIADAAATISGRLVQPWQIFSNYIYQWMSDPALAAEFVATVVPPDGWSVEWEAYHPIFVGYQVAPDETITGTLGVRTEGVAWLYDPTGWNFYGVDGDLNGIWATGDPPQGTELAHYEGGLADWIDPPAGWPVPEQDPDTGFLVDQDLNRPGVSGDFLV